MGADSAPRLHKLIKKTIKVEPPMQQPLTQAPLPFLFKKVMARDFFFLFLRTNALAQRVEPAADNTAGWEELTWLRDCVGV